MKQTTKKLMALGLSAVIAIGGLGGAVCARAGDSAGTPVPLSEKTDAPASAAAPASFRDETVYVLAGADGTVEKVIVSDWLQNPQGLAHLKDTASLEDVENVKGSETFTAGGDGRVWDARGGDVYTQGVTDQEVPVAVRVSYTLDGSSIAPDQLAGKSGRVVIRFDYDNRLYEETEIGGKTEKIYVPFAVVTGVMLDNERFSNVSVANGRLYNDGDRIAVIGLALPGMQENLDLDPEDMELPSYVEIAADVEDFELETTFTVAVSDPFRELETGKLEDTDGLTDSLDELTNAMAQLLDGSGRLYDGLGELLEKSGTLSDGVDRLAAGAEALQNGGAELRDGAAQLKAGTDDLQTGLQTLSGSSEQLNAGAKQTFDALLASANGQLAAAGAKVPELTAENYGQVLDGVIAILGDSPAAKQIAGLKGSLDSYNAFYQGLQQYTAGVDQAAAGAGQLSVGVSSLRDGADALAGGAKQLNEGVQALRQNVPALVDGVTQLHDGAGELAGGLAEFNEKGVQRIVDALDGDLELLADRLEATVNAAKNYRTFSGGEEAGGQVKFIYRTEAIQLP